MAAEAPDHTELRIKHLEMIQSALARMSANSGTTKRYAVVIAAAAISLGRLINSPMIVLFVIAVIIVFALLDARYLRLERCYRALFDSVRCEPPEQRPDFRLTPVRNGEKLTDILKSWSVAGLYGALILFLLALIPFLGN